MVESDLIFKEIIGIDVRKRLEARFKSETEIIYQLLPDIQNCILDEIFWAIITHLVSICPGAIHQSGELFKTREGQLFKFSLAPNIRCPEEIHVIFYPAYTPRSKVSKFVRSLKTDYGGYTHIVISYSAEVEPNVDLIQSIAESVISTSYKWIYSHLYSMACDANEKITERLYGLLREITSEVKTTDNLWLGYVHKGKCHYLVENRRVDSLLLMMSKAAKKLGGEEPLGLASKIIAMDLKFEKSAAHEAFLAKRHLNVNIGKLPYSINSPDLVAAEQIIFGTDEIVVIPVSHIERTETFLVAFSPAQDSEFWIKMFERNQEDFDSIFNQEISSFPKLSKEFKTFALHYGATRAIGDTLGHLMATLFDRIKGG